jgi:hypothetical protein
MLVDMVSELLTVHRLYFHGRLNLSKMQAIRISLQLCRVTNPR